MQAGDFSIRLFSLQSTLDYGKYTMKPKISGLLTPANFADKWGSFSKRWDAEEKELAKKRAEFERKQKEQSKGSLGKRMVGTK